MAVSIYKINNSLGINWSSTAIHQVDLNTQLKTSDAITIHLPLTNETKDLLNLPKLSLMKISAVLINTARGGIVNENNLYKTLGDKKIAVAALDVFQEEAYKGSLCELDNIILTQHMGSCSNDCREDMEREVAENVVGFFGDGKWERVV